jgi:CheY-like chemotaxis protein
MSRVVSAPPALSVAPRDREGGAAIVPTAMPLPRVLCVDDEPAILVMLERALSAQFEVVASDDPVAALALLEHGRFSVIVSDMKMPGMAGIVFLQQAKKLTPTSTRLAFTAGLDWQLPPDIAFGVLTKPCPLPLLQATVSAAAQCHALLVTPPGSDRRFSDSAPLAHAGPDALPQARSGYGPLSTAIEAAPRGVESGLRPRKLDGGRISSASALADPGVPALSSPRRLALALLGTVVELWPRATLLGRAMDCDIVIRDERLSPRHLRLFSSWRGVTVQDVSGKGDVRLNGERLVGVRFIQPGDCIGLSACDIHVQSLEQ